MEAAIRKKIAVGDLGEFWYGDYKEPFVQLDGAVPGYPQGVVLKDDEGKLLCAYCGKVTEHLGNHAAHKHGLSASAYKREVGLLQKSALVSERLRRSMIASGLRQAKSPDYVRQMKLAQTTPTRGAANKRRPEALNKTGRCLAQIIAVAQTVARKNKGRITQRAMKSYGIPQNAMEPYGGYARIVALAGASMSTRSSFTDIELLTMLRDLADKLGRTPRASDLRRYGLPTWHTYRNRFHSWNEACQRAGVPSNTPVPLDSAGEVAILTAYAVLGSTQKVARHVHRSTGTVFAVLHRYGVPTSVYGTQTERAAVREQAAELARRLTADEPMAA